MQKNLLFAFCFVTLLFNAYKGFAQAGPPASLSNGIIPEITPPSPEASSLGKFGEWPVSLYTGLPNVSIPLYNISVGEFNLPVQLSYHAGGVKIDEVSSWVGTNWALNAGGMISRTIVGLPDEKVNAGFLFRNQQGNFLKSSYDVSNQDDYTFMRKVSDQLVDAEPDLFYFNFAGMSGKFYFDKTGTFRSIPATNLRLIKSPFLNTLNTIQDQHWEIADQNGNIYFFGSYQQGGNGFESSTMYTNAPSASQIKPTGWYLTQIILANNADVIYFDYVDKSEHYELARTNSFRLLISELPQGYPPASGLGWDETLKINTIVTGPTMTSSSSGRVMLNKIRWKQGEIDFTSGTIREDLNGTLLDRVAVYDKNANKIKDFQLNYTAFNQRHYLMSVSEKDKAGTIELKHVFEYTQAGNLPAKGSKAQDHWGFYNGADGNSSLLPPNFSMNSTSLNANREPNETTMQFGALNKITFPTGGYTLFEYEAHHYDPASPVGGGSPPSQITSATLSVKAGDYQPPGTYPTSQTFTIGFAQNTPTIAIQFSNYNKAPSKELAWLPLVRIEKLVNGTYQPYYYWDAFDKFPVGNATPNGNGLVDFSLTESLTFTPGDYRLVSDQICGNGTCGNPTIKPSVAAQLTYSSYNGQLPIAGGLRIKQITNYGGDGVFANRKKFSYVPGKLLIYPKYFHEYGEDVYPQTTCYQTGQCGQNCFTIYAKYKEVTSSSQSILGFTQGAPVGYTLVTEQDVDATGNDLGYTETAFTFEKDVLNTYSYSPFYWPGTDVMNASVPLNSYDYKRGLLWYKNVFKKESNGTYVKIQTLKNEYQYNDNDSLRKYNTLRGIRINKLRSVNYPCGNLYNGYSIPTTGSDILTPDFGFAFYDLITGWVQSVSTTETTFDQAGNNPLTITTSFSYDNNIHLLPTAIAKTDSKGRVITQKTKYPDDYGTLTATDPVTLGIQLLQQRNIQAKPIEATNYLTIGVNTPVVTGSVFNAYSNVDPYLIKVMKLELSVPVTDFIVSSNQSGALTFDSRYKNQVYFDRYDNFGNISQAHQLTDKNTSFLWGYNYQYPVAKIINSDYNTVSAVISQSQIDANTSNDANLRSALNVLRTDSRTSKSLVTTYTYAPLIGITSETDPAGKTTFYEYDNFNRLKNIKDYQGNIIKNFQYNYLNSCGTNCVVLPMQTFNGSNTISYPVGVFNVNGQLLGKANNPAQFIGLWNANAANQARGVLSGNPAPMSFNFSLATNQTQQPAIIGLRYYQFDLTYNQYDGVVWDNCDYVDFGDGTGMRMGATPYDQSVVMAPNTYKAYFPNITVAPSPTSGYYLVHSYADNTTKTLTMYHSDDSKKFGLGNGLTPATSMTKVSNLSGNIPQYTISFGGSSIQSATYWSVANITNWNSVSSIQQFGFNKGDGVTVCTNVNYAQDFMANNKSLKQIKFSDGSPYASHLRDVSFKISKLKSDWNTYFTNLEYISLSEDHWNHEDLSALTKLNSFGVMATNQNHSNDPTNNPAIPLSSSEIDNIIIQIAAGAGQSVTNGVIYLWTAGGTRTNASTTAFNLLKSKGWSILFDGVNQ